MAAVAQHFNLAPKSFILKTSTTVVDQEKLVLLVKEVARREEEERAKGKTEQLALYLYVEKL
jgi:hypothetical protein